MVFSVLAGYLITHYDKKGCVIIQLVLVVAALIAFVFALLLKEDLRRLRETQAKEQEKHDF